MSRLVRAARRRTGSLAGQLARGDLDVEAWGNAMVTALEEAHTRAVVLGRRHGGDRSPAEADDRRFAEMVVDGEVEYLVRFMQDVSTGRYTDEEGSLRAEPIQRRAALYADRIVGTANEAWVLTLPEGTAFAWELGAVDEGNCAVCPARAQGSPYTADTLPGTPGDHSTPCLANCRCSLRSAHGQSGFSLEDADA